MENKNYEQPWFTLKEYLEQRKWNKVKVDAALKKFSNYFSTTDEMWEMLSIRIQETINLYFSGFFDFIQFEFLNDDYKNWIKLAIFDTFEAIINGRLPFYSNVELVFVNNNQNYSLTNDYRNDNNSFEDMFPPTAIKLLNQTNLRSQYKFKSWKEAFEIWSKGLDNKHLITLEDIKKLIDALDLTNTNVLKAVQDELDKYRIDNDAWRTQTMKYIDDEIAKKEGPQGPRGVSIINVEAIDGVDNFTLKQTLSEGNPIVTNPIKKLEGKKGADSTVPGPQGPAGPQGAFAKAEILYSLDLKVGDTWTDKVPRFIPKKSYIGLMIHFITSYQSPYLFYSQGTYKITIGYPLSNQNVTFQVYSNQFYIASQPDSKAVSDCTMVISGILESGRQGPKGDDGVSDFKETFAGDNRWRHDGDMLLNNKNITEVKEPYQASDAATKNYVDTNKVKITTRNQWIASNGDLFISEKPAINRIVIITRMDDLKSKNIVGETRIIHSSTPKGEYSLGRWYEQGFDLSNVANIDYENPDKGIRIYDLKHIGFNCNITTLEW